MSYCLKCHSVTDDIEPTVTIITYKTKAENETTRTARKAKCSQCGKTKTTFIKNVEGGLIDIHALIGKLPKPKGGWTLPGHKYTGPYNPLDKQLDANDNPLPGQEPFNQVDAAAMKHYICYRDHENDKHGCDRKMIVDLDSIQAKGLRERIDKTLVKGVLGAKLKLGLGAKNS